MSSSEKYHFYLLYSHSHDRYYKGMSENVEERLETHNAGQVRSTRAYIPWEVMYTEGPYTRSKAREVEKYYKTAAGRRKLKKILGNS